MFFLGGIFFGLFFWVEGGAFLGCFLGGGIFWVRLFFGLLSFCICWRHFLGAFFCCLFLSVEGFCYGFFLEVFFGLFFLGRSIFF